MSKANPYQRFLTFEDNEHIRVVNHIKDKLPDVLAFHVPSEGNKSPFERYKHSLMGNLKGLPDFLFLHPIHFNTHFTNTPFTYHGLAIELKAQEHSHIVMKGKNAGKVVKTKGVLSEEQRAILIQMNALGYKAVCCWGADEAIKVINEYFKDYLELQKALKNKKTKFEYGKL